MLTVRNDPLLPLGRRNGRGLAPVFTTGQAAKLCRVAPRTVCKWFDAGRLKGYRLPLSNDRRIPRDELLRFLRENGMPVDGVEATAARVLLLGVDPHTSERIAQALPGSRGWEVLRASSLVEAGVVMAGGLAAAVIDCAVGRREAVEAAMALRRMDPRPYVAILANEDEGDEAGLLAVADAVRRRPADPASVAGLLGVRHKEAG